ncbi:trypsin-like peptidase domain-containing protein [Pedobacter sp. N36a]|uniref:trypsin-like peptidase domain-containing protein n=1 Tax=Pedobacter sp. N36a TaxID=2767996 RepID=UPI0016576639|nr:trypsin-like peptidase domain-containing protein [Pedobacter sp. N36a]MBC8988184.1 trypsin-like peptidase domain-containing protein [Pedobacter sp. N36a]
MTIIKNTFKTTVFLLLFLLSSHSYGQSFHPKKLEQTLLKAIEKAYGASVRIWGFDTLKKVQTSAQFSGVVVSSEGHILTAAHVNQPGNTYLVTFPNGKSHIAKGLGEIEFAENKNFPDVAVMKMIGEGIWPQAEMGWSSSLKVDELCLSIAYPETLNQPSPTIRFGRITDKKNEFGFVQSTCIMEPGDSGGPLFDYLGRVIALHSAIGIVEDENYEIPVDLYRKYWTALNIPKTYGSFPSIEDAIGNDPHRSPIKNSPGLKDKQLSFVPLPTQLKESCLRISSVLNGKEQQVNGTLLSVFARSTGSDINSSLVISKSSLIGDHPVILAENKSLVLKVISRDSENDLVLLQALPIIKGGVQLKQFNRDSLSFQKLGKFLISPQSDHHDQISIVGSLYFKSPKRFSIGYLGAMATFKESNIVITAVQPNSPAGVSGIEVGDRILSINGIAINKPEDYGAELVKFWPYDHLTFRIKRLDSFYSKNLTLDVFKAPLSNHPAEQFPGGKSIRRDGFSQVFSHDAKIKPDECGGPVFDINNRFCGINIARSSRTTTLVIPAAVILRLIENYQSSLKTR